MFWSSYFCCLFLTQAEVSPGIVGIYIPEELSEEYFEQVSSGSDVVSNKRQHPCKNIPLGHIKNKQRF